MTHIQLTDELQERAILYAAGALPEDERREHLQHLEEDGCAVCREAAREFESIAQTLAMGLPHETPSPAVKERLMAQISLVPGSLREMPRTPRRALFWTGWLAAAASWILIAFVFNMNANLRNNVESLSARVAELETQIGSQRTVLASLTSPQVRVVNLSGQGATPQARGRIFWDERQRNWRVYVGSLPPAPAQRTYQLWFVPRTGNPVSASVFNTTGDGSAELDIAIPAGVTEVAAAAVTTEPAGGVPQPTGGFVLLGMTD
jgi:anti-sigma-K factor RskA